MGCEPNKPRFVLDSRWFNQLTDPPDIRLETLQDLRRCLEPGSLLCTVDLKDGFTHVPLAKDTIAVSRWEGVVYVFVALPFGSNFAPGVFQKITGAFGAFMRSLQVSLTVYLDDITLVGLPERPGRRTAMERAVDTAWVLVELCYAAGFVLSPAKCSLVPSTSIRVLGMIVDTVAWAFRVPPEKRDGLLALANEMTTTGTTSLRQLQRFVGKGMSLLLAMPALRFFMRPLYGAITAWSRRITGKGSGEASRQRRLTDGELTALRRFTTAAMEDWQDMATWPPERHRVHTITIATDAAGGEAEEGRGWGGVLLAQDGLSAEVSWRAHFEGDEATANIAVKETLAVVYTLSRASTTIGLRDCWVHLLVDNTVALAGLRKYDSKMPGMREAIDRFLSWQLRFNVNLTLEYVRSADNPADEPSRSVDVHDLQLADRWYKRSGEWANRRCTVDICASKENRLTTRYYCRGPSTSRALMGVNCFSHDVSRNPRDGRREFVWANPPRPLIGALWRHLKECRASGLLLFPDTPQEPWYASVHREAQATTLLCAAGTVDVFSRPFDSTGARHGAGVLVEGLWVAKFEFGP